MEGSADAFGVLRDRYEAAVRSIIRKLVRDDAELDDILQETFIRAYTAILQGGYQHRGQLLAYLVRIASNNLIGRRRAERHEMQMDDSVTELAAHGPSPEDQAVTRMLFQFLDSQLDQSLGVKESTEGRLRKLAFNLYYVDGLALGEVTIALKSECDRHGFKPPSEAAVNNWLAGGRLIQSLTQHLVQQHPDCLERLCENALERANLTLKERQAWLDAANTRKNASDKCRASSDQALVKSAGKKIASVLGKDIKRDLHSTRLRK